MLRPRAATYAGFALLTCATLAAELLLTRVMSVRFYYHFAFAIVSLCLFGLTLGAVFVHLLRRRLEADSTRAGRWLVGATAAYGIALPLVARWLQFVAPGPQGDLWGDNMLRVYVVAALPFACAGVAICLLLTRFEGVGRLYAADLVGSGIGGLVLIGLLAWSDPPAVEWLLGAMLLAAATLFAWAHARRALAPLAALGLALAGLGVADHLGWLASSVELPEDRADRSRLDFARWNAFSRVSVQPGESKPFGWGMSGRCPSRGAIDQKMMLIDRMAATPLTRFTGDLAPLDYLRCDVANAVYELQHDAKVLIIGMGGGRDILSALRSGQRQVTAVEVNGLVFDVVTRRYADFVGRLAEDPRVTVVRDEARSFLERSRERFGVVQISLVDTFAASTSGAFALTENSLYTTEAWETFLRHLEPEGVLSVSRWHSWAETPYETYRTVGLARAALESLGVRGAEIGRHVAVVVGGLPPYRGRRGVCTILVKRAPFTAIDLERLDGWAEEMGFHVLYVAGRASEATIARLLEAPEVSSLERASALDISPPTDDRPFFFLMRRQTEAVADTLSASVYGAALDVLASLLVVVGGLAAAVLVLPLTFGGGLAALRVPRHGIGVAFFALIGGAFMLIEMAQVQRLTLFLGHPSYALTAVLSTLLVASGVGSYWSAWIVPPTSPGARRLVGLALALLAALALLLFGTDALLAHALGAPTPLRLGLAILVLVPAGVLMGTMFPTGMRLAQRRVGAPVEWFWGINGALSVVSAIAATRIAVAAGLRAPRIPGSAGYVRALGARGGGGPPGDGGAPASVDAGS